MRVRFFVRFFLPLICSLGAPLSAEPVSYEKEILPLIETYCVGCHSAPKRSGTLDLTRFKSLDVVQDAVEVWYRVGKRLEDHEMPPKKATQPTDEERKKIIAWTKELKANDMDCNKVANDENVKFYRGYVMSRRLNRTEYGNTMRDLLRIDLNLKDVLPSDGAGGEGFDNNGDALFISPILMEKYLQGADLALDAALPDRASGWRARMGRFFSRVVPWHWRGDPARKREEEIRNRILVARPSWRVSPKEAAGKVLAKFLPRAFRRPPDDEDIARFVMIFDRAYQRGDGYERSVKLALKASLISPHFLFLAEPQPEEEGVYRIGDYQLASRLSYFLWSTMPDAELFQLAAENKLHEPEILKEQVGRMLRDSKARALAENFGTQWLGLTALGTTVKPDATRFPDCDDALLQAMREETILFLSEIIRDDRSLLELVDSDHTFLNERLARHYGIEGIAGSQMRVVQLADRNRGGVLGMGSVLTATSHPLRTSPVLRGKWVLQDLLGEGVPPPLPNAGTLPDDEVQPDGLTLRQRLEAHRSKPECASCHQKMDPIGFGLENFDPVGRWRTEQNGKPLDTTGELPSGDKFNGPQELKTILMKRKGDFTRNVARRMMGYAMGRGLTKFDLCTVDDAVKALDAGGYRPSLLIGEIVSSYPFQHRYSKK